MREDAEDDSNHLFPGAAPGKPLQRIKKFWRSATREASLEGDRLRDNHHTHASHLVSGGLGLAIVGRLPVHAKPLTTNRHAHLAEDPLRAAAEQFDT